MKITTKKADSQPPSVSIQDCDVVYDKVIFTVRRVHGKRRKQVLSAVEAILAKQNECITREGYPVGKGLKRALTRRTKHSMIRLLYYPLPILSQEIELTSRDKKYAMHQRLLFEIEDLLVELKIPFTIHYAEIALDFGKEEIWPDYVNRLMPRRCTENGTWHWEESTQRIAPGLETNSTGLYFGASVENGKLNRGGSDVYLNAYSKPERRPRIELRMNRDFLRRHGINTMTDLEVATPGLVRNYFRFVEFDYGRIREHCRSTGGPQKTLGMRIQEVKSLLRRPSIEVCEFLRQKLGMKWWNVKVKFAREWSDVSRHTSIRNSLKLRTGNNQNIEKKAQYDPVHPLKNAVTKVKNQMLNCLHQTTSKIATGFQRLISRWIDPVTEVIPPQSRDRVSHIVHLKDATIDLNAYWFTEALVRFRQEVDEEIRLEQDLELAKLRRISEQIHAQVTPRELALEESATERPK